MSSLRVPRHHTRRWRPRPTRPSARSPSAIWAWGEAAPAAPRGARLARVALCTPWTRRGIWTRSRRSPPRRTSRAGRGSTPSGRARSTSPSLRPLTWSRSRIFHWKSWAAPRLWPPPLPPAACRPSQRSVSEASTPPPPPLAAAGTAAAGASAPRSAARPGPCPRRPLRARPTLVSALRGLLAGDSTPAPSASVGTSRSPVGSPFLQPRSRSALANGSSQWWSSRAAWRSPL
mmetsp:Transcript_41511/g.134008  ORF Transcript_41511/g.134008 Transcript_41511/m.134008 type:complete len:232 (-) Transcript_41511:46-741(-)